MQNRAGEALIWGGETDGPPEREASVQGMINFNPWWTTGTVLKEMSKPVKRVAFYESEKNANASTSAPDSFFSGAR